MRKRTSVLAATVVALSLAVIPAVPALAQSGSGSAVCNTTWSYTWVNSTQTIRHTHDIGSYWEYIDKPAGVSSHRGIWEPGAVFMSLTTPGNFSGAVYGCSA